MDRHQRTFALFSVGVAVAAMGAYAFVRRSLGAWTIDDALITYAQATELVHRGSWGAYAGGPPVEGYSNALMFLLVVALRAARVFHPLTTHLTVELLEFGTLAWLVLLEYRELAPRRPWVALLGVVVFVALQLLTPAVTVWYGSGLEGLQVSLVLVALHRVVRLVRVRRAGPLEGFVVAAALLVRPEGPAYVAAAGLACLVESLPALAAGETRREAAIRLSRVAALSVGLLACVLAFRHFTFGAFFPNTYYAKANSTTVADHVNGYIVRQLLPYTRIRLGAVAFLVLLVVRGRSGPWSRHLVLSLAALTIPVLHGSDWMGEHRFGVPFIAMVHFAIGAAFTACLDVERFSKASALTAFVAVSWFAFPRRNGVAEAAAFVRKPHITAEEIAVHAAFPRLRLQKRLGLPRPVAGVPDIGASTWVGRHQLIDTASLADLQMARIRQDMSLVNLYQQDERRIDLAEVHQWQFDGTLIGKTFFRADAPYPSWEGTNKKYKLQNVVAVRWLFADRSAAPRWTDLPAVAVAPSPRNEFVATPGALVRIEVLVVPYADAPGNPVLRVAIAGGGMEELAVGTVAPGGPRIPVPEGSALRQGFLVVAPRDVGDHAIVLELQGDSSEPVGLGSVRVVSADALPAVAKEIAADPNALFARWRLAELAEQSVSGLSEEQFGRLVRDLAKRSRARSNDVVAPFDALVQDARDPQDGQAWFADALRASDARVCEAAALAARPPGSLGQRALRAARVVDDAGRSAMVDLGRCESAQTLLRDLRAGADEPEPRERYRRALACALLDPASSRAQSALLAARASVNPAEHPAAD